MKYFDIPFAHYDHWIDIMQMVMENYVEGYQENDLLLISSHLFSPLEKIKENYPDYNKVIAYQLEPLIKDHWWDIDYIISRIKDADEIWDYDLDNIKLLKEYGIDAKYRPFVYAEGLKKVENKEDPDIDVFFYGTLTKHRCEILQKLTNLSLVGKNIVWSYGLYQDELNEFISRSKIILDLQTSEEEEKHIQKQSRIFYALINDKCVVSEKSKRNYFGDLIIESDFDNLGKTLDYLLENDRWKDYSNVSERFKKINTKNLEDVKMVQSKSVLEIMEEIPSGWKGHFKFAEWIVNRKQPETIVDLGVDYGYSSFAFGLPKIGHVYGIDNFEGDEWCGMNYTYDYAIQKKSELDINNITFIKGYFDEVSKVWSKEIDILHIDGFHSYDAVKNDYETWRKFLKKDGIVLFHDTCANDPRFGVDKFFDELDLYKVNFTQSYGLGVASENESLIREISEVFNIPYTKKDHKKNLTEMEKIIEKYDINGHEKSGGTDKNTAHSYIRIYENLLNQFVEKSGNLLEIGVQYGGSILLWNEYLKNFKIFGVDIYNQIPEDMQKFLDERKDRIDLKFTNAYTQESVDYFKSICPEGFDVIVDDGPHTEQSQIDCISLYLDLLKEGGYLIIEDIQDFSSIDKLRICIPKSDTFCYELTTYDNRDVRGRWDDIIFAIKKVSRF